MKNVLKMEHGGNYTAALFIAVGCEALSRLQDERTDFVLARLLLRHGIDEHMAEDVIEALRHSLAHMFDTTFIRARKREIELIVSWGEREHMSVRHDPPGLYLNVRTMWADLQAELAIVKDRLAADSEWAKEVPRDWQNRWSKQVRPGALHGWEQLFGS